jgi:hypothetical protein
MKNPNIVFIAMASALAFALGPVIKANTIPQGGPTVGPATHQPIPGDSPAEAAANRSSGSADAMSQDGENRPIITIHSAGNILRGKTGSFVLKMSPPLAFGGMYVNFKVSGTAVEGVDYVSLHAPAYIGQSGYGVISLKTLADPRGSSNGRNYSVVVTLEPGAGYFVGEPKSAVIWISTSCVLEACW